METTAKKSKVKNKVVTKKPATKSKVKKPAVKSKVKKTTTKKESAVSKSSVFIKSDNKNDFLEQLSGIKQEKKNTKIPAEPKLSLRNTLSVALLSPYRLPIDAEKLAMQSARIAGMAFVVIGALLTIFHLPAVNDELVQNFRSTQQSAQLLAFQTSDTYQGNGGDYQNGGSDFNTYEFRATISVTPNYDLRKYVVKINTSGGTRVEIKLVDPLGKVQTIGYGEKQDSTSGSWLYTWDAKDFAPGAYKIYGQVTNNHGTYDTSKVTTKVLEKVVVDTTTADTGTGQTQTGTTSPSPTPSPTPSPSPEPSPLPIPEVETATEPSNEFSLSLSNASNLNGFVDVDVKVTGATAVEMFVLPKSATTPRYLGLAVIKAKGEWIYKWNTANTPNGEYRLYAVAKLSSGKTNSPYKSVKVANPVVKTDVEPVKIIEPVVNDETTKDNDVNKLPVLPPPPLPLTTPPVYQEAEKQIAEVETEFRDQKFEKSNNNDSRPVSPEEEKRAIEAIVNKILSDYRVDINNEMENLKSALRAGNEEQVELIYERLEELQNTIIKNSYTIGDEDLVSFIAQRLRDEFDSVTERVTFTERIIKERVGEQTFKDSDGDGITDYDETVIYNTDPNSADSDNDGFTDGSEILNGYNPNDASPEAVVVYESPQNKGQERKDILAIKSIENVKVTPAAENNQAEATPAALIKGVGLPNSFVTLYIFSTPVIVTVKTDAEGAWEYTFDKELEDGDHEVYVGVTDNAGSIVAKSAPLRFVKTAEAFTPIAEAEGASEISFAKSEPGFLTQNMILLVMSISVVIIGLILMLLGLHLKSRRGEHLVQEGFAASV